MLPRRSYPTWLGRSGGRPPHLDSNFQYAGAVNLIVASLFSPRAFHRVRTAGGLGDWAGGRAVARCRTQADRLILHFATACAEDVADIGAAGQVAHADPQQQKYPKPPLL